MWTPPFLFFFSELCVLLLERMEPMQPNVHSQVKNFTDDKIFDWKKTIQPPQMGQTTLSNSNHVPGSVFQRQYPYLKWLTAISHFGVSIAKKTDFRPAKAKNSCLCLSIIWAETSSVLILGHFFGDPDDLYKFRWSRTKIRGTFPSKVEFAENGQNPARRL